MSEANQRKDAVELADTVPSVVVNPTFRARRPHDPRGPQRGDRAQVVGPLLAACRHASLVLHAPDPVFDAGGAVATGDHLAGPMRWSPLAPRPPRLREPGRRGTLPKQELRDRLLPQLHGLGRRGFLRSGWPAA